MAVSSSHLNCILCSTWMYPPLTKTVSSAQQGCILLSLRLYSLLNMAVSSSHLDCILRSTRLYPHTVPLFYHTSMSWWNARENPILENTAGTVYKNLCMIASSKSTRVYYVVRAANQRTPWPLCTYLLGPEAPGERKPCTHNYLKITTVYTS